MSSLDIVPTVLDAVEPERVEKIEVTVKVKGQEVYRYSTDR